MSAPYLPAVTSDVVIDLSHWDNVNGDLEEAAASGIAAVILKATEGRGFVDQTFLPRAAEAKAAGLLVGAYHFLNGDDPSAQMTNFLQIAAIEGDVHWLAIDWEPNQSSQADVGTAAQSASIIQAATGRWPVLYVIRYMLSSPSRTLSNCPLWLAEYGTRPICPPGFSEWVLWQHTDGQVGSSVVPVAGIGPCDRSRYAGTADQLKAWWLYQEGMR